MHKWMVVALALQAMTWSVEKAIACEQFISIEADEMKTMRDALVTPDTDPLDKLYAFQILSCSDQSSIRNYAIEVARNSKEPILISEMVLAAFMRLDTIDILMSEPPDMNDAAKSFLEQTGKALSFPIRYRDRKNGCVSLGRNGECEYGFSASVNGATIEVQSNHNRILTGVFSFSDSGEMIGFVTHTARDSTGRLPAKLRLLE